jgi:hypothetical protein
MERTAQLATANKCLQEEIVERQRVEDQILKLNAELERRVLARTMELAEANQELEAFTYSVAHDLQAPLRNIQSYTQLLEEDFGSTMPDGSIQYFKRIAARVKHMAQLVSDLLNLSRIARHELNRQETDLGKLVADTVSHARAETKDRNIEWLVMDLAPVACDPGLVRQVFANLISNAVKYTQPREQARIEIGQLKRNGDSPIYIRDNGVGFDMKFVDKLFGVFQRLHPPTDFEGTGVGLATVARIVRKHGGAIWAEGEENNGATFYFTLGPQSNCEIPRNGAAANTPDSARI